MDWKQLNGTILTALVMAGIILGFAGITRAISGTNLPLAAVQSGSMEPNIPTGSLIFIQRAAGASIVAGEPLIGDVVVYYFPNTKVTDYLLFAVYDPLPWSHRVIDRAQINGTYYFLTKGDANMFPDQNPANPSTWVPEDRIIGKIVMSIPYLGYPFLWFKNIWIVTAVVLVLIIIILMPSKNNKNKEGEGEEGPALKA